MANDIWSIDPNLVGNYGNTPFGKQVLDYANQQLQTHQGGYESATRNSNVGSWGGSAADAQAWLGVAANHQNAATKINSNLNELLNYVKKGTIDGSSPGHMDLARTFLAGDPLAKEKLNELDTAQDQLKQQDIQLGNFRNKLETQQFGGTGLSLSDALNSTAGDIGNLNKFLGGQEARTFNEQLKPLIQMALGAQGLSDSGANVELQSRALGQLQQAREQSMMQAALGARGQIQGLERQDVLGDVGARQQMMNNQFDLSRAGITMQFQQQLEQQREQLARELSGRRGSGGVPWATIALGAAGGLAGGLAGGPAGAMAGAGVGMGIGGGIDSYSNPNQNYSGLSAAPSSFFAAADRLPSQWRSSSPSPQTNSMFGPYRSGYQAPPSAFQF